ncbi:pentapeptide repeat-containing protein [Paenibacillus sp. YAF4_2]|uniref:pentapeptide repeat-containing protein n=1 Tax=Paenibacillus sp. YAF4_2 TaxID=3233085 RepID=UPI003F981CBD
MFQYSDQKYTGVDFGSQDLRYGELISCTFNRCSFVNGSLEELISMNCRFIECDFRGALLNGSIHKESAFDNCNFNGANLFVAKFEACKMTGSDFSGSTLDGISIIQGDWSYTNLRHSNLVKQDLCGIKFHEADLSGANLEKADLRDCDLTMAVLSKAKLHGADVRGADMAGVDFKNFSIAGLRMDREQTVLFSMSHGAKVG